MELAGLDLIQVLRFDSNVYIAAGQNRREVLLGRIMMRVGCDTPAQTFSLCARMAFDRWQSCVADPFPSFYNPRVWGRRERVWCRLSPPDGEGV